MRVPGEPRLSPPKRWKERTGAHYDLREVYFPPPYDPADADPSSVAGCGRRWDWHISCTCPAWYARWGEMPRMGLIYK